jgi:type I restriction enzyme R subunit
MTPEEKARQAVDKLLDLCGWVIQDRSEANLSAARGVALREVSLKRGHGEVDYLLFVDGKAIGIVEAKPEGHSLTGVEEQSAKYVAGLPFGLPSWRSPLPFSCESTGTETRFTSRLDPEWRSRSVFAFHRPETLLAWVQADKPLNQRLRELPPLITDNLWKAQVQAIKNLEQSFAANRPRALIQMATGSGKTFTAVNFTYRLVKYAGARRVLFLVDRGNLGKQTFGEFQQFVSPVNNYKFTEEFIVQHLTSNTLDTSARVVISTVQRLYSMLKGETEPAPDLDDLGIDAAESLYKTPLPVEYNPAFPIETFDFIITDECHRSIYNLWRQVLEYFDAYLIGLTATPSKQTFGFFHQNLVMEYGHEKAVADGVNVNYDVYRIQTDISAQGSKVQAGLFVDKRDRLTRARRWELLDQELSYDASRLDRDVVAEDQIRTVLEAFRDLVPQMFPGRSHVPKTLIFAKDDSHADDIVRICREVFDKGNDFCKKITYKTTGEKPETLIQAFRNSYFPRIAVTVDMIATGTDIKPLEVVFFMRVVRSRSFFEQMKGRGVRVISETELQAVTPDARSKTHFVIVDAIGMCEGDLTDSRPLERKPTVSFEKLLQAIALGNREPDALVSLAGRLSRLDRQLDRPARQDLSTLSGGLNLATLSHQILDALDPDVIEARAKEGKASDYVPTEQELHELQTSALNTALAPVATNPQFRNRLTELQKAAEQTIDALSQDKVLFAGAEARTTETARDAIRSFRDYIEQHRGEITALQILYSRPYRHRLTEVMLKELEQKLRENHAAWTEDRLWDAFATTVPEKVKGRSQAGRFADLVSLVGFALAQEPMLEPFADSVRKRFDSWLESKAAHGVTFNADQQAWLELIRDHIATSLSVELGDFDYAPFNQRGGLGKAHQLFGSELPTLLDELNDVLAA